MIPIKEAEKQVKEMFVEPIFKPDVKISKTDTGSPCWHIGKRDLIVLLALIYEVEPETITIDVDQG